MKAIEDGERKSGEQWIVRGPLRYVNCQKDVIDFETHKILPVDAEIVEKR